MDSNSQAVDAVPFMFRFFETVQVPKISPECSMATQYTTSSGGRETEYDDDPDPE